MGMRILRIPVVVMVWRVIRVFNRRVLVTSVNSLMSASSPIVEAALKISATLTLVLTTVVVVSWLVSSSVFVVIGNKVFTEVFVVIFRIIFVIVFAVIFVITTDVMIITGISRSGCWISASAVCRATVAASSVVARISRNSRVSWCYLWTLNCALNVWIWAVCSRGCCLAVFFETSRVGRRV